MFESITQAISVVGFPIVAFIMAGWYIIQKDKTHTAEVERLTNAINDTNNMINALVSKIDTLLKLEKGEQRHE